MNSQSSLNNGPDPYLILMPEFGSKPIPAAVMSFVGKIKRASAWDALGLTPNLKSSGLTKARKNASYRFSQPISLEPIHWAGIESGLRISDSLGLADFEHLIREGVQLSEFVGLTEHRRNFGQGIAHVHVGDLASAVSFFEVAHAALPTDRTYRNKYFEARQALGDIGSILMEVEANANADELPGCVHCGKAQGWLKALYAAGQKEIARSVVSRVDDLLRRACDMPQSSSSWAGERDWRISKHAQFVRNARAYGIRLVPYCGHE